MNAADRIQVWIMKRHLSTFGQLVFAQVMAYMPLKAFSRMVAARRAQHKVQDFSCLDQFLVLAFAQLTVLAIDLNLIPSKFKARA